MVLRRSPPSCQHDRQVSTYPGEQEVPVVLDAVVRSRAVFAEGRCYGPTSGATDGAPARIAAVSRPFRTELLTRDVAAQAILAEMRRSARSRLLLVGLLICGWLASANGEFPLEVVGSSGRAKHITRRLGDRISTVELKVGQVVQIEVPSVGGRRPALQIVRYDPRAGYEGVLVPSSRSPQNDRYRAVGVGRVDIGGVSQDVLDHCRRIGGCVDLMGDVHYVVSVLVTP